MHSALRRAIEKGNLQAAQIALDHGADIEEADMHGDPGLPLRIACFKGHNEIVRLLIQRGANIDAPNAQGPGGPLRMAVRGEHFAIIELLIEQGANIPTDLPLPKRADTERRRRSDRRRFNFGPPNGLRERRAHHDRRVTHVRELELDDGQWEHYFSQSRPMPIPPVGHDIDESVSLILSRARD